MLVEDSTRVRNAALRLGQLHSGVVGISLPRNRCAGGRRSGDQGCRTSRKVLRKSRLIAGGAFPIGTSGRSASTSSRSRTPRTALPPSRARTIRSPASRSRAAASSSMDGVAAADFDMIDLFIARYHIDPEIAPEAMAIPSPEIARMLVDMNVPRTELVRLAHGMTPAKLAEVVAELNAMEIAFAYSQDAGAQDARQPGACDQRQGRSAAARRRCGDRGGARLRRDRDDDARLAQRLVERARLLRSAPRSGAPARCSNARARRRRSCRSAWPASPPMPRRSRSTAPSAPSSTATTRRGRRPSSPPPMPRAASRCAARRAPAPSC